MNQPEMDNSLADADSSKIYRHRRFHVPGKQNKQQLRYLFYFPETNYSLKYKQTLSTVQNTKSMVLFQK